MIDEQSESAAKADDEQWALRQPVHVESPPSAAHEVPLDGWLDDDEQHTTSTESAMIAKANEERFIRVNSPSAIRH